METYQLIHVPKTGGTALYNFLHDNFPEVFFEYMYEGQRPHELKAMSVRNPIVIVRDPLERIVSVYRYWLSGSEIYKEKDGDTKRELSFSEFLDDINIFNVWSSYVGAEHILPQSCWMDPASYSKSIVIKYRKDLSSSMGALLEYLGMDIPDGHMTRINITSNSEEVKITDEDRQKIMERYWCDFLLWHDMNNSKEKFKKVI
jgi:Sulfotransferase family